MATTQSRIINDLDYPKVEIDHYADTPEKALFLEVIGLAMRDWSDVVGHKRKMYGASKVIDPETALTEAYEELKVFFFTIRPEPCNLAWICENVAHNGAALWECVHAAIITGKVWVPYGISAIAPEYTSRKINRRKTCW